ncbi:DNA-processing protein DprA [Reichenbachiella agarivorans]|uniref:DNA-processing protein DprA n=1 Tax=Reichenbachiella agarivorans TaxID=2979464 RepID=A0ABY6CMY7_9BACT|nr:DNA-processing protein DprA [Reichenbachiella agarivorans]UXP31871.1 DNA-processing protein DprA [Reichenbachiella agarivorans]
MEEERLYVLALKFTNGIGDVLAKQLISYCGSAKAVFHLSKGRLLKIPGIGSKVVDAIVNSDAIRRAELSLQQAERQSIQIIPYFDKAYPSNLKLVNDAPLVLFYKGAQVYNDRKIIGIVGTRNATNYGKQVTAEIVEQLKAHDTLILSGLAYGIDIASHKAALKNDLSTVGVLAGGLDMIYPAAHKGVVQDMLAQGGILSEHPPGVKPDAHHFPARNRIIAGMCDALVVVEAAAKGGALITANIAYSYNREVFAVPGELGSKYSEGCNALLRAQRALIYTDIKDIEYNLNWTPGKKQPKQTVFDLSIYSEEEQRIITVLSSFTKGLHLDELCWKSQLSINQTVSLLLNLEFSGLIESLPGKQYKLTKTI